MSANAWWLLPLILGAALVILVTVDAHWPPSHGRHEHGGDR